jgi:hypothetical protein
MPVAAEDRCPAVENGRKCRKRGRIRYGGKGKPLCRKHYQRAVRNGGATNYGEVPKGEKN